MTVGQVRLDCDHVAHCPFRFVEQTRIILWSRRESYCESDHLAWTKVRPSRSIYSNRSVIFVLPDLTFSNYPRKLHAHVVDGFPQYHKHTMEHSGSTSTPGWSVSTVYCIYAKFVQDVQHLFHSGCTFLAQDFITILSSSNLTQHKFYHYKQKQYIMNQFNPFRSVICPPKCLINPLQTIVQ